MRGVAGGWIDLCGADCIVRPRAGKPGRKKSLGEGGVTARTGERWRQRRGRRELPRVWNLNIECCRGTGAAAAAAALHGASVWAETNLYGRWTMSKNNVMRIRGEAGVAQGLTPSSESNELHTPSWGVQTHWQAPGRDAGLALAEDEDDDDMDEDEEFEDDEEFDDDEGFEDDDEDFLEDDEEDLDDEDGEDDEDDEDDDL